MAQVTLKLACWKKFTMQSGKEALPQLSSVFLKAHRVCIPTDPL